MPSEVTRRYDADESGAAARGEAARAVEEAEACIHEACAVLVRADPACVEQAGGQFRKAIEIFTGWRGQPPAAQSPRRLELHRAVQRAGRLLEGIERWRQHRRAMLFPEEAAPPCYGVDGRAVVVPASGSMALQG